MPCWKLHTPYTLSLSRSLTLYLCQCGWIIKQRQAIPCFSCFYRRFCCTQHQFQNSCTHRHTDTNTHTKGADTLTRIRTHSLSQMRNHIYHPKSFSLDGFLQILSFPLPFIIFSSFFTLFLAPHTEVLLLCVCSLSALVARSPNSMTV